MYELTYIGIGLLAGMAIGVMVMAVLQRYSNRQERKPVERAGAIPPQRWNGRYPADAERKRRA